MGILFQVAICSKIHAEINSNIIESCVAAGKNRVSATG